MLTYKGRWCAQGGPGSCSALSPPRQRQRRRRLVCPSGCRYPPGLSPLGWVSGHVLVTLQLSANIFFKWREEKKHTLAICVHVLKNEDKKPRFFFSNLVESFTLSLSTSTVTIGFSVWARSYDASAICEHFSKNKNKTGCPLPTLISEMQIMTFHD